MIELTEDAYRALKAQAERASHFEQTSKFWKKRVDYYGKAMDLHDKLVLSLTDLVSTASQEMDELRRQNNSGL